MGNLNIFKALTQSTAFTSVSIDDVMSAIKTGFINCNGTQIPTNAIEASKEDKSSTIKYKNAKNKYTYLKTNSVMIWCPNANFLNKHRHTTTVNELSGFVYCDIDGINPNEAKELLIKLPFVYSVWTSLSGTGVGFIIKANWTVENFKSNYKGLASYFKIVHDIELDKTSDVTRVNCFSYDKNYYCNREATNISDTLIASYSSLDNNVVTSTASTASTATNPNRKVNSAMLKLVEQVDTNIDYSTKTKQAIGYAGKSMGSFIAGNRHNFLTSLIGIANKMAIPYNVLVEEFELHLLEEGTLDLFDVDYFNGIYASFEHQKQTLQETMSSLSVTKELVSQSTDKHINILVDKYLDSQLPTMFSKNTLLVSPTGSGKSTYVIEVLKGKRIVICPNTAILRSFKSFKGVSVYYGEEKSDKFTDIILTTQDSFSLLTTVLEDRLDSVLNYLIIIDEFHTLVSSANKGYKYNAICKTLAILEEQPLIILGLTATPIETVTSNFYNTFDTIKVTQKTDVKRNIQMATYEDYRSFVIERCLENFAAKTVSVVYKNTKNVAVLKEALEAQGLSVAVINADTKETETFSTIVDKGTLDVDVILATCILKEGVSIKGKANKSIKVDYIITGNNHYSEINQLASRVRNAEVINITLASSINSKKDYTLDFLLTEVVKEIDTNNSFLLNRVNTVVYTEIELKLDQRLGNTAIKYDTLKGKYVVDSVYKDFLIYEAEKKVCTVNPLFAITNLLVDTRFGLQENSLVDYKIANEEILVEAIEKVKAEKETVVKMDFKQVMEKCTVGETILDKLDSIKEEGTKEEKSMAFYTRFVYSRQKKQSIDKAIEVAEKFLTSKSKFNSFVTKLEISELLIDEESKNGISTLFFKELQTTINNNQDYSANEIHNIIHKAAVKTGASQFIKITKTKATQWFMLLGKTTERKTTLTVGNERKTIKVLNISSFGLSDYNYVAKYTNEMTEKETEKIKSKIASMFERNGKVSPLKAA